MPKIPNIQLQLNAIKKVYSVAYLVFPLVSVIYEGGGGGSICNENPFITPSANALGFYAICKTKDQSVAVIMMHKTLFYFSKFDKL